MTHFQLVLCWKSADFVFVAIDFRLLSQMSWWWWSTSDDGAGDNVARMIFVICKTFLVVCKIFLLTFLSMIIKLGYKPCNGEIFIIIKLIIILTCQHGHCETQSLISLGHNISFIALVIIIRILFKVELTKLTLRSMTEVKAPTVKLRGKLFHKKMPQSRHQQNKNGPKMSNKVTLSIDC